MPTTPSQIKRAEGTIARATGGRRRWDPVVLREVAECALAGIPAERIRGRPADVCEFNTFSEAVRKVAR